MEKAIIEKIKKPKDIQAVLCKFSDRLGSLQAGAEYIEKMSLKYSDYATVLAMYQDPGRIALTFSCENFSPNLISFTANRLLRNIVESFSFDVRV